MNKIHSYSGNRTDMHSQLQILHGFVCCTLALLIAVFSVSDIARAANSSGNATSAENNSGQKKISVQKKDNQIIFNLPLDENIEVSPDYSHPNFRLNFSPAVKELQLPQLKNIDLVKNIDINRSSIDEKIASLQILLNNKAQFLLSRTRPENLQLKFVPGLTRKASTEKSKQKAGDKSEKESVNKLQDVQFTQDEEGTLFIKLLTKHKANYRPQPNQGNELVFLLSDLKVPSNYAKIYDLQKFDAPVKKAILQDTPQGGELELSFDKRSPISVTSKDNKLIVSVQSLSSKTAAKDDKQLQKAANASEASKNKTQTADAGEQQNVKRLMFPEMKDEYRGEKISLDLQNANIEHVLRLIAKVAEYNLVIGDNVSGQISLKLDNVPWDQALDLVLIQKNLGMVKKGNILRVVTIEQLQKEQQKIQEAQQSAQDRAPLHTTYIQVNYTKAGQLQSNLQNFLSDRGNISIDQRTNQLIVEDIEKNIKKIRQVVKELDKPERQVLIEARLVYATDSFQRSMGVQWGGGYEYRSTYNGEEYNQGVYGSSGTAVSVGSSPENSGFAVNLPNQGTTTMGMGAFISKLSGSDLFTLDAQLQIGESKNQAKTISAPRVVTLNNQEAEMVQGTMVATQSESESGGTTTEYTEATLNLSVTPQITPNDKLILEMEISDDSPVAGSDDIETREASTKVIVDNDETIVLGGVREVSQSRQKNKVPFFADIPVLGWLFKNDAKNKEKRELLIFIKPKILEVS